MLKTFRVKPLVERIESVIAPMPTDSPGNPKTIKKQDRKNIKHCFLDTAINRAENELFRPGRQH
jgi:hypothetical protein